MAKIYAPNKQYTGISAGVTFSNGVGECADPYLIGWFKDKGYKVVETQPPEAPEQQGEPESGQEKGVEAMDIDALIEYAAENGIDIGKATTKEGILKKIQEVE